MSESSNNICQFIVSQIKGNIHTFCQKQSFESNTYDDFKAIIIFSDFSVGRNRVYDVV